METFQLCVHVYNNICCRCRSLLSVKDGGVSKIIPLRPDGLFAYRLFNVFQVTTTAENLISIGRKCAIEEHGGEEYFSLVMMLAIHQWHWIIKVLRCCKYCVMNLILFFSIFRSKTIQFRKSFSVSDEHVFTLYIHVTKMILHVVDAQWCRSKIRTNGRLDNFIKRVIYLLDAT